MHSAGTLLVVFFFFYYIKSLILARRAPSKISLEVLNAPREVTYYFYAGLRTYTPTAAVPSGGTI